ncbi:hypothetical protein AMTRI_Chr03g146560 [Amborella trichopoda]
MRFSSGFCVAMTMVVMAMVVGTGAQECANKLVPCASYLNSTTPGKECCDDLKQAIETELPCLCALFNDPSVFKSLNINRTQALLLPEHCGFKSTASACNSTAGAPSANSSPNTSSGGSGSGKNSSPSMRAPWYGLAGVTFVIYLQLSQHL